MPNSKISALSAITTIVDTDELLSTRSSTTKKITGANLKAWAVMPAFNWSAPTGAISQTFDRCNGYNGASSVLATQRLSMVAIYLPIGAVITSITFWSSTQALVAGAHQLFGLFDSSRVLLRGSSDDTSTAWGATSAKTLGLTSTFTTTYSGLHYLGILVDASTVPTIMEQKSEGAMLKAVAPIISGTSNTGITALPSTANAITAVVETPYAYVS